MRLLLPALALLAATACAGPTYQAGMHHVRTGDFYKASGVWLRALDEDEFDQGALRGLDRYALDAYDQQLDVARELEAAARYVEALAVYDELLAFEAELTSVSGLGFTARPAIAVERDDVETALARQHLAEGGAAASRGAWESAVGRYEAALALRPALDEATAGLGRAQLGWGREALAAGDFEAAGARFERARQLDAGDEAARLASQLHAALGRYYLRQGGCRRAVTELRAVALPHADLDLALDLAVAMDCARTDVVVQPFETVAGDTLAGTAPGAMISDRMEAVLRDRGSEFLKLLDPTSATAKVGVSGTDPLARPGRLYEVRGRLTQLRVERPEPVRRERNVQGTLLVVCPLPEGVYYQAEEWCEEPVTVVWDEASARVVARASGSIRIVDPRTAEQVLTRPMETELVRESTGGADFRRLDSGERVAVGPKAGKDVVGLDEAVLALREPPTPLPTDGALASDVTASLAEVAAQAVLDTIDRDPAVAPPVRLELEPKPRAPSAGEEDQAPAEAVDSGPTRAIVPKD